MKQTAVEWLFEQIYGDTNHIISYTTDGKNAIEAFKSKDAIEAFEKAKAMEREQMIRFAENYEEYAYNKSENNRYVSPKTPDQYYNETYGGEK
jgi:hypothetical protein